MSNNDKRQKDSDEINPDDYDMRGEVPILKSPSEKFDGTALMALYRECFYEVFPGCAGETPVLQVMALRRFAERLGALPSATRESAVADLLRDLAGTTRHPAPEWMDELRQRATALLP